MITTVEGRQVCVVPVVGGTGIFLNIKFYIKSYIKFHVQCTMYIVHDICHSSTQNIALNSGEITLPTGACSHLDVRSKLHCEVGGSL